MMIHRKTFRVRNRLPLCSRLVDSAHELVFTS
jgi:hypothetical protein